MPTPNDDDLEPVLVYSRVKPKTEDDELDCVTIESSSQLKFTNPLDGRDIVKEQYYRFARVFDEEASQYDVFKVVVKPMVADVLSGKPGLLFTYGVTGSGKTHTQLGTADNPGAIPRVIDVLFNSVQRKQINKYVFKPNSQNQFDIQSAADAVREYQARDLNGPPMPTSKEPNPWTSLSRCRDESALPTSDHAIYAIYLSNYEIYQDNIYDLLEEPSPDVLMGANKPKIKNTLRHDTQGNMFVKNLTEIEVKTAEECFEQLWLGQQRRRTAHTVLNATSSRSHCVFNIRVLQAPKDVPIDDLQNTDLWWSQLTLVDLAGSERANRTDNRDQRLKEAGKINESLMVLRRCIETLRNNQQAIANGKRQNVMRPPYNDAKLTNLFRSFFDGCGSVRMIICINPSVSDFKENQFVMTFAELANEVQIHSAKVTAQQTMDDARQRRLAAQYEREREEALRSWGPSRHENVAPVLDDSDDEKFDTTHYMQQLRGLASSCVDRCNQYENAIKEVASDGLTFRDRLVHRDRAYHENNTRCNDMQILLKRREDEVRAVTDALDALTAKFQTAKRQNASLQRLCEQQKTRLQSNDHQQKQPPPIQTQQSRRDCKPSQTPLRGASQSRERPSKAVVSKPTPSRHQDNASKISPSTPLMPVPEQLPSSVRDRIATFERNRDKVKQSATPPTSHGVPVANRRHQRRSKSVDRWLVSENPNLMPLDNVNQVQLRGAKRKSGGEITPKDFKRVNKFGIHEQRQSNDGNIEDVVVRGDVLSTRGGGAAVVLNDSEIVMTKPMCQSSPLSNEVAPLNANSSNRRDSRKQRSSRRRDDRAQHDVQPLQPAEVRSRCSFGVEGHGGASGAIAKPVIWCSVGEILRSAAQLPLPASDVPKQSSSSSFSGDAALPLPYKSGPLTYLSDDVSSCDNP